MSYSIEQTDAQLLGTTAAIGYRLSFHQAAQHIVHVEMFVANGAADLVAATPNWIPGSYKVRDFSACQADVAAFGPAGERLEITWLSKNRLHVAAGGADVTLRYIYYGHERTVRQTHINRNHAFINPANCLMYVEGRQGEIHHVAMEHPWANVSTALSPVRTGVWGALNYDVLADSPIEAGDHYVQVYERHGAVHEVAITGAGDFDRAWLAEQTVRIVDHAVWMWGRLPYDRYVFIIQLLPGQYGGLEHARSSVNMFDSEIFNDRKKAVKLLALLCHEYFHLWNVKRIRPAELGPFDYNTENYTRMLWLAEGVTSYYDDLIAYRCGFHARAEYLAAIADEHLTRLLDVPGRRAMSIKDSSFLSWVKLYMPTADSPNRFPSYYLKGGVIFMLLDMWIIARTECGRSLDDGMRALMARYGADPAHGVTEEEFIAIVSGAVGVDIGEPLRAWLNGTDELPIAETVRLVGLEWRVRATATDQTFGDALPYQPAARMPWLGIAVEEGKPGLKIARVLRGSPAEAAGIGADDELIALNGGRVASSAQFSAFLRGMVVGAPVRITAASEGRLYETEVAPIARDEYELVERADATDEERRRLEAWLKRP